MDSKTQVSFTCDLRGKTAFVTGGSSGIGAHLAGVLAEAGANVVVAARREQELAKVVAAIEKRGGKAFAVRMDVTDSESIERGFLAAEKEMGVANVLLNNAGITSAKSALERPLRIGIASSAQIFAVRFSWPKLLRNVSSRIHLRVRSSTSARSWAARRRRSASYAASKAGAPPSHARACARMGALQYSRQCDRARLHP